MKYIVTVSSNSSREREYVSDSRNALALADKYGRREGGEVVTIRTAAGKIVSRAIWTSENGGRYFRVTV